MLVIKPYANKSLSAYLDKNTGKILLFKNKLQAEKFQRKYATYAYDCILYKEYLEYKTLEEIIT
jgi:hypothetical protein